MITVVDHILCMYIVGMTVSLFTVIGIILEARKKDRQYAKKREIGEVMSIGRQLEFEELKRYYEQRSVTPKKYKR